MYLGRAGHGGIEQDHDWREKLVGDLTWLTS